jgi:hypothetical protein
MIPIFLIAPPRAKASLLMRMLDATHGVTMTGEADEFIASLRKLHARRAKHLDRWADEEWPRHRLEEDGAAWKQSVRGMLQGWIGPRPGSEFIGLRLSFLGREDWASALREWSWLLEIWPEAKIIFLTRDQGEIEISMLVTPQLRWVPEYGKCVTCVGGRVKRVMESIEDFHLLNPARTVMLDASQLDDFEATSAALLTIGVPLDYDAWQRELAIKSGTRKDLQLPPPAPPGDPAFDPFHPLTTAEQMEEHEAKIAKAREPVFLNIDPFAEGVTVEQLHSLSPPRPDAPAWTTLPEEPKTLKLPEGYVPRKPRRFKVRPAQHPRAIVYPWLAKGATWEELRYSIRSIEKHFADKDCPIYILGEAPPAWLVPGGRVRWIEMKGYRKSVQDGFFEARAVGLQIAGEVLWMNDDFYLLRDCGWDDFRVALTCGDLVDQVPRLLAKNRPGDFARGKIRAAYDLLANGCPRLMNFTVHAPLLFERTKAVEILKRFQIGHRGGFATLYHNWHATPHEPHRGILSNGVPSPGARTLNHSNSGPNFETAWHLQRMFPDPMACENPMHPVIHKETSCPIPEEVLPSGKTTVCTIRYGSLDWMDLCAPTLDAWCARNGYELKITGKPDQSLPSEKFVCVEMLRDFLASDADHMIYVDADVWISDDAPGFPKLPGFALTLDTYPKIPGHWEKWKKMKGETCPPWIYRNAGVWSCDREAARRFLAETEGVPWNEGIMEQHQFNVWWARAEKNGMTTSFVPSEWNRLCSHNLQPSWFYHLAGRKKEWMIERVRMMGLMPRKKPRALFALATEGGEGASRLLNRFRDVGFDVRTIHYGDKRLPEDIPRIADKGGKFQLAQRHLDPKDHDFDYLFLWDDDLEIPADFDPSRFIELMRRHGFAVAQPALTRDSEFTHPITLQKPGEARQTNFVEIMAPVYTRAAWEWLHPRLDPYNFSGWGYDFAPIPGKRGIIDCMPVSHKRPIRSNGAAEMVATMESRGWESFRPKNRGAESVHENCLKFEVRGGEVLPLAMNQYESRGDCALEILRDIVRQSPEIFEGREGSVFYGDRPPTSSSPGLNFCTTLKRGSKTSWLPFPCFSFLKYVEVGIPDSESMIQSMLADDRAAESDKIFWIGANTHPSREALCKLGKRHPDIIDAEMIEWDRSNPGRLASKTRQVSIPDHRTFKYLIDCPGHGYSLRLKWLLATGRPVFVIERDIVEPWMTGLVPWAHYVPVKADLSDLLGHHARLEASPDLREEICQNARIFASERLSYSSQLAVTIASHLADV